MKGPQIGPLSRAAVGRVTGSVTKEFWEYDYCDNRHHHRLHQACLRAVQRHLQCPRQGRPRLRDRSTSPRTPKPATTSWRSVTCRLPLLSPATATGRDSVRTASRRSSQRCLTWSSSTFYLSSISWRSGHGKVPVHTTDAEKKATPELDQFAGKLSEAPLIVYFSSVSENTHRFVEKLGLRARRIPLTIETAPYVDEPYVLVCPTYGGGKASGEAGGFVPKQVIKFLNDKANRSLIRASSPRATPTSGKSSVTPETSSLSKCRVPYLYRFELMGDSEDVERVRRFYHFAQSSDLFTRVAQSQPQPQ